MVTPALTEHHPDRTGGRDITRTPEWVVRKASKEDAMQSSNPIFTRSEGFNGRSNAHGNHDLPGQRAQSTGYSRPLPVGHRHARRRPRHPGRPGPDDDRLGRAEDRHHPGRRRPGRRGDLVPHRTGRPTSDSAWAASTSLDGRRPRRLRAAMVNSFKKVVSPALVLAYAALEGVFVGAFSKVIEARSASPAGAGWPRHRRRARHDGRGGRHPRGVQVLQHPGRHQVPQVGHRAMFGFVAVSLLDFVLSFFGNSFGFNGFGTDGPDLQRRSVSASAC